MMCLEREWIKGNKIFCHPSEQLTQATQDRRVMKVSLLRSNINHSHMRNRGLIDHSHMLKAQTQQRHKPVMPGS